MMNQKIPYSTTSIAPERTKADIEKMLKAHGIIDIEWTTYHNQTSLKFIWKLLIKGVEKEIMFRFSPPNIPADKHRRNPTTQQREKIHTKNEAASYRLLFWYLKNKLEAVRWGLESMEKEFLSHAVVALPDGSVTTVGEQIETVYEMVRSPALEHKPAQNELIIDVEK